MVCRLLMIIHCDNWLPPPQHPPVPRLVLLETTGRLHTLQHANVGCIPALEPRW